MSDLLTGVAPDRPAVLSQRPRVRPDLLFSRELGRGPDRVHLLKVRGGRVFEVSAKERFLIGQLDGSRTLDEIGQRYAARFRRRLGVAQWSQLLWLLHQRDLLDTGAPAVPPVPPRPALARLAAVSGRAFSVPAGAVLAAGLLLMYASLAVAAPRLWQDALPAFGDWRVLVAAVAVAYLSAMLHELAHAVAAAHHGLGTVRINLVALSCRVEDYQFLPSRRAQAVIAAAGGVVNSLVVLPFVIAWWAVPQGSAAHGFAAAVVLVGAVQALANYLPVAPLDGYKMLSHLSGQVALGPESRRYLWSRPRRWLTGHGPEYPRRARLVLGLYGAAWHAAAACGAVLFTYAAGRLLEPVLGRAGYAASAAAVVLTVTLWLAARPPRRTPTDQPTSQARGE